MENMPEWATIAIGIATAIGGLGIGSWIISLYKTKRDGDVAESEVFHKHDVEDKKLAFDMFKEYIENLKSDLEKAIATNEELRKEWLKEREENVKSVIIKEELSKDNKSYQEDISKLKALLEVYQNQQKPTGS